MLTYVINTSENKTLESDPLFKLVGYNKIRWMNYGLRDLEECADEICERQTMLGAEDFRIVLLVDFYGFDRVRTIYGAEGYSSVESGVDLSIYFPLLEAYMVDHLFSRIRRKDLVVQEKHVFYIQGDKNDGFNVLENKEEQLEFILEPEEESVTEIVNNPVLRSELERRRQKERDKELGQKDLTEAERQSIIVEYADKVRELSDLTEEELLERREETARNLQREADEEEERAEEEPEEEYVDVPCKRYSRFRLHCTKRLSLDIKISDYPYTNRKGLTFHEFFLAFKLRESQYNGITRHHYYASFGSGAAKAAFDNLSLSLYLIKLYEREERLNEDNEFVIDPIDPEKLKRLLITSWNKICSARTIALKNSSKYFDIKSFVEEKRETPDVIARQEKSFSLTESKNKARAESKNFTPKKIYDSICAIASEEADTFSEKDKKELDKLMAEYLVKRDDTKESEAEYEFRALKETCNMIPQCPSQNDYENVVAKKKEEIASLLSKTIEVEYISKDYTEQRKTADKAYADYVSAKQNLGKRLFGDFCVWFLALFVMLIPFIAVRGMYGNAVIVYLLTGALFTGLFVIAFVLRILPLIHKLNRAKQLLKKCYRECRAKQELALLNYKSRYQRDLIKIENLRYDLRNVTRLYNENRSKNRNIEEHRQMLEMVEDKLSAILNNLGVAPVVVHYNDLEDEFDVSKSFRSTYNKIYKIFSLDAIENLFGGKGR